MSCLGIGKRRERGGLSVKGGREERGKKKLVILELERAKNLKGKEFTCYRHLSAPNLALRDDGLK